MKNAYKSTINLQNFLRVREVNQIDNFILLFFSSRNPDRSQSAFGIQNKTIAHQRKAVSDDESCRKDDLLRRNSASAPPQPPFSDSAING